LYYNQKQTKLITKNKKNMPIHKFTITIIGNDMSVTKITRFSQKETDYIVYYLKHTYNIDCKVEKTRFY